MRDRVLKGLVIVGGLVLVTGCGSAGRPAPSAEERAPRVTMGADGIAVLGHVRDVIDAVVFTGPDDLLSKSTTGIVGVVDQVVEGRSVVSGDGYTRVRDNSIVVRVRVERVLKDAPGVNVGGLAYVSLPRGVNSLDEQDKVVGPDGNPSVADYARALRQGIRVVVLADPQSPKPLNPGEVVEKDPNPAPQGATMWEGFHPQAITFDEGDRMLSEWGAYTFDRFLADAAD